MDRMASGEPELLGTPFLRLYAIAFKLRDISVGPGMGRREMHEN